LRFLLEHGEDVCLRNEIKVLIDEENANKWILDVKGVNHILEFLLRTKRKKGRKKLRKNKSKGERFNTRLEEG